MPKFYPLIVFIVFGAFLIPNLIEITVGQEHFPFSNNPMFGHYVTTQDTTVTFDFVIASSNNEMKPIDYPKYGLWEVKLKRYYFSNVYGSSEPGSPQGYFEGGVEGFEQRNEAFFLKLSDLILAKNSDTEGIYLLMDWLTPSERAFKIDTLGYYDVESRSFNSL
ncbi:hypothetical protein N6H18_00380 [Reichenbachiella agarivorans]|uniref:Uncharacterized protein n=1 Tax=Reichenbachiella agarivorans TaxID=2979464 RepID=A0ABY6CPJ1_9BACT|nr:hypothetical protein [Reichenbachiella agarivorans]UXP32431.1 hypothetical protein N6H18_00380 [Reichenbachiella agarivorans]